MGTVYRAASRGGQVAFGALIIIAVLGSFIYTTLPITSTKEVRLRTAQLNFQEGFYNSEIAVTVAVAQKQLSVAPTGTHLPDGSYVLPLQNDNSTLTSTLPTETYRSNDYTRGTPLNLKTTAALDSSTTKVRRLASDNSSSIRTLRYFPIPAVTSATDSNCGVFDFTSHNQTKVCVRWPNTPPPPPTVDLLADGTAASLNVAYNATVTLSWSVTNSTACTITPAMGSVTPADGSQVTAALTSTTTFTMDCSGLGGTASDSVTVNVAPPNAPALALCARLSTGQDLSDCEWVNLNVSYNQRAYLHWQASDATSCSISQGVGPVNHTTGQHSLGGMTATQTYTLTCSGAGASASASVKVTVGPAAIPTVNLMGDGVDGPLNVASGATVNLSWTSTNATACSISSGVGTVTPASGNRSVGPLTTTVTYTLSCTGPGGSSSDSVKINVAPNAFGPGMMCAFLWGLARGGRWGCCDGKATTCTGNNFNGCSPESYCASNCRSHRYVASGPRNAFVHCQ